MTYHSYSSAETNNIAARFAENLLAMPPRTKARIVALEGDLGAGKTTFVQGFLRALKIAKRATSPTFTIVKKYRSSQGGATVYHLDCYRLQEGANLDALGLSEMVSDPHAVLLIEWPEKLPAGILRSAVRVRFRHGKKENIRDISIPALRK